MGGNRNINLLLLAVCCFCICACVNVYLLIMASTSWFLNLLKVFSVSKTWKPRKLRTITHICLVQSKKETRTLSLSILLWLFIQIYFLKRKTCVPLFCNIDAFVITIIFSFIHSGRHNKNHRWRKVRKITKKDKTDKKINIRLTNDNSKVD